MKEPYKDQERVGSNIPSSCKQLFLLSLAFYPLLRVIGRWHWKEIEDLGLRFFSSLKVSGCLNDTGFFLVSVACIGRPQRLLAVLWQASVGLYDYCYYSISHYTLAAFTIPNSMSVSLVYLTARPPSEEHSISWGFEGTIIILVLDNMVAEGWLQSLLPFALVYRNSLNQ